MKWFSPLLVAGCVLTVLGFLRCVTATYWLPYVTGLVYLVSGYQVLHVEAQDHVRPQVKNKPADR